MLLVKVWKRVHMELLVPTFQSQYSQLQYQITNKSKIQMRGKKKEKRKPRIFGSFIHLIYSVGCLEGNVNEVLHMPIKINRTHG